MPDASRLFQVQRKACKDFGKSAFCFTALNQMWSGAALQYGNTTVTTSVKYASHQVLPQIAAWSTVVVLTKVRFYIGLYPVVSNLVRLDGRIYNR